VWKR